MKNGRFLLTVILLLAITGMAAAAEWRTYSKDGTGLLNNEIRAVCIDSFGVKWFGTADGLTRFDGESWTTYTTDDKLAHNTVNTIAFEITSYGPEIWVGTNGGVSVISVVPDAITVATPYTTENTGLISNMVRTAAVDTGHVKWFGTDAGVSTFTGQEWASYTTNDLLINNDIRAIAAHTDGWIYLGTNGSGVSRIDALTSASPYDTDWTGIASNDITAAYVTPGGIKWFGTDSGISRHESEETKQGWTTWTTDDGIPDNYINAITSDSMGRVWIGTDGGASFFDGETWTSLKKADGLAGDRVLSLAVDTNGSLWFGTDAGVSHFIPDGTGVETSDTTPETFAITGCYPNPFNPETTIGYVLPREGIVTLDIYNLAGQKVRSLLAERRSAGVHSIVWDGTNDDGMRASSGIYISTLRMGNMLTTGKMVLVK